MKKLLVHWKTTVKGIVYFTLLVMYYLGKISTQDWVIATGSVMTINSLWQKDADKLQDKDKPGE
jgi:hypothetical protein